jgi:hypothetical protein
MAGYIVLWQGRPMRDYPPSTLRAGERGRLFTCGRMTTVWRTRAAAVRAMRRSIRAWGESDTIGRSKNWWVIRLVPPFTKVKA